jgi:uncharacterized protein (UPF0305 family)
MGHTNFDEAKTAKWLRQEEGKSFIEYMHLKLNQELKQLRTSRELVTIHQTQGRIEILEWFLKIREES